MQPRRGNESLFPHRKRFARLWEISLAAGRTLTYYSPVKQRQGMRDYKMMLNIPVNSSMQTQSERSSWDANHFSLWLGCQYLSLYYPGI